jgi:hypothetical protein
MGDRRIRTRGPGPARGDRPPERREDDAAVGRIAAAPATALPPPRAFPVLQRQLGNRRCAQLVGRAMAGDGSVQREEGADPPAPDRAGDQGPVDVPVPLSTPPPVELAADEATGPGDYPTPNDAVVMASWAPGGPAVQRDDDAPRPSADAQVNIPFSVQATLVYRNLNIAQIRGLHLDIGHEPQVSWTLDSSGELSQQYAIGLVNWHWMPPWNRELEVGLQAFAEYTLLPRLGSAYGGQVQVEQHIVPWFSITVSGGGSYKPPLRGTPGSFEATGGVGALIHFDGF